MKLLDRRIIFTEFCFGSSGKMQILESDFKLSPDFSARNHSVALGKLLNLSELEFHHLKNGRNHITLLITFIEVVTLFQILVKQLCFYYFFNPSNNSSTFSICSVNTVLGML